jgi:parallel beta-helix repeat protein
MLKTALTLLPGCFCLLVACSASQRNVSPTGNLPPIVSTAQSSPPVSLPTGSNFYVAPDPKGSGNGSINKPWSLENALNQSRSIKPGDTVWLRGGTYTGAFNFKLSGTPEKPIIFRAYGNERSIIDNPYIGDQEATHSPVWVTGANVWLIGLEVINSNTNRTAERPIGIAMTGANTRAINCIVHDCGDGIFAGSDQRGGEVNGCLIYNNGWVDARVGGTGHGIYMQNASGTKIIKNNILVNNYGYGIHAYTGSNDVLNGFDFIGNVVFGSGLLGGKVRAEALVGGTKVPARRIRFDDNDFYGYGGISLGYTFNRNEDLTFTNNRVIGMTTEVKYWLRAVITGNRFQRDEDDVITLIYPSHSPQVSYDWDKNEYRYPGKRVPFSIEEGAGFLYFDQWKSQTGFDRSSTFGEHAFSGGANVYMRPNVYNTKKAIIVVYNWQHQSSLVLDLASIMKPGTGYEVRNASDYFGNAVLRGTYDGQPVKLPMSGLSVAVPIGGTSAPRATGPAFNVFILQQD